MDIDSTIIHNSSKLETNQRPIPMEWMQGYISTMEFRKEFRQWKIHSMKKSTLLQLDSVHEKKACNWMNLTDTLLCGRSQT